VKVDIAGPGFINITLDRASQAELVRTILLAQGKYGRGSALAGVKINLEFISANPTGPLHLGHTRWAAVGDALGRVLSAAGADVTREFYINDRGRQMDLFGQSVQAAAQGNPIPEDGYQGEYIADLAKEVVAANPGITSAEDFREAAYKVQLAQQQREKAGQYQKTGAEERVTALQAEVNWAFSCATLAAILVCSVVMVLFISAVTPVDLSLLVIPAFILAMASLIVALLCFFRELRLSMAVVRLRLPGDF
jgi:arginyl-tRNA synthetase